MSTRYAWLWVTLITFLIGVGCDNTVDPFEEEAGQFSIQGVLTLSQNQHFIRVKDLKDPLIRDSTRVLDATVTLENLATGTTETLADSVVIFDGIFTHNFRTDQDIQPGARYRLTVERPDGRRSQATATMPERTEVDVTPPKTESVGCMEGIILRFQNVPDERLLRRSVGVRWNDELHWVRDDVDTQNGFRPVSIVEEVIPRRVLDTAPSEALYCTLLDDNRVRIAYTHFGPDWPTDRVLANPIRSNVENGLGVFGGVHRDTLVRTLAGVGSE